MTGRRRLASVPVAAALAAAGGLAFHRVFTWSSVVPVVTVAAIAPSALAVAVSSRARRWPLWASAAASLILWLLVVSETLFRADTAGGFVPAGGTVSAIGGALRDSWKAMLTTILPAPASPRLLVLVHALVWLAAFAGAETALRTRAAAVPVVPAAGVLVIGVLLGVDGPGSNLPLAAIMVALAGLCVLARSPANSLPAGLALGAPLVACLALAGLLAGPRLPFVHSGKPFDPREHVTAPPPQLRQTVSPLDEVSGWLLNPGNPLFTIQAAAEQNWRLAVLDRFDGTTWEPSARFIPTGTRVPPAADVPPSSPLRQAITIQDLPGVWLPAADRPVTVSGASVATDPGSGVLATVTSLRPGVRYRVVSDIPRYTMTDLAHAPVAGDAQARADLVLPAQADGKPVPELPALRQLAQVAAGGSVSPVQEALRLAGYLRANEVYDVTAAPGHTYRNIDFFLLTTHHGSSEQFATSFAVMARLLGLPSRVVVGFRPGTSSGQSRWVVHSGDVLVWPEVDFQGIGWVPFYPTPQQQGARVRGSAVPMGEPSGRQRLDRSIASSGRTPVRVPHPHPARNRQAASGREAGGVPWPAVTAAAAGVLAAGYLLAVLLVPYLRARRRRRQPTASGRIIGAWQQSLDHLRHLGLPATRALTSHEVAEFGASAVGHDAAGHLRPMADMVDWVGFAPFPPVPDDAADQAWRHSDEVGRLVIRVAGRGRRLRWSLDPRSLLPPRR